MVSGIDALGLMGIFREKPRTKASNALARILTMHDMSEMSYEEGISRSRRQDFPRPVALGVMVIPCGRETKAADVNYLHAVPGVTCDLRREGIGVLLPHNLKGDHFLVAIPDTEEVWRFFGCECRHNSPRPGGWWQLGLHVEWLAEPESNQMADFRSRLGRFFD
ncbi:MAG: hypothetical protein KDA91_14940 [Planctomycetaceae bacterium]|nr:hypothetical protein [Planctomycetaceae bacterium]